MRVLFLNGCYILFIYIFGRTVSSMLCRLSPGGATLRLGCAGCSLWRLLLLRSTGSRCLGSVVGSHGLNCPTACGIFPDQGMEAKSPELAGRFLTAGPPGKSPHGLWNPLDNWRSTLKTRVSSCLFKLMTSVLWITVSLRVWPKNYPGRGCCFFISFFSYVDREWRLASISFPFW